MTLNELKDQIHKYPEHFQVILVNILNEPHIDFKAHRVKHLALRESHEKFSTDFMFHWSILTFLDDVIQRLTE